MVMRNRIHSTVILSVVIISVLCLQVASQTVPSAQAQITYVVSKEWSKIWVNKDGSIDLMCNITMSYTSGSPHGIVTVGMPKGGFQVEYVRDISGSSLQYSDASSSSFHGIDVSLKKPIVLNQPNTFIVFVVVPGMVSSDSTNTGNVGMQFSPSTFASASGPIGNVRVAMVLPQGVNSSQVKYPTGVPFDNVFNDPAEENKLVVYWERNNWSASQQFMVGVSFPATYVTLAPSGPSPWLYAIIGALVVAAVGLLALVLRRRKREPYVKPRVAVEALGALRGLTAVEAAVVLDLKPVRVLTMIIFSLLMKHKLQVTQTAPIIKVKQLEPPAGETAPNPRYYEIDFLKSVEPDGTLNEMRLARTFLSLRDNVDRRLRGYSRTDTVGYYKSVVSKAWDQVTRAGAPELKGEAIDQNIDWLLADSDFENRFKAFPPMVILPRPGWWWYWYGPGTPSAGGRATTPTPIGTGQANPIPIQEFANNVVRGLEQTSNNIVKDVQGFTNRLVAPQRAQERSVRGASHCVCACHACACACACVGCACACAGGGAR
jgi:hypothetical protein